MSEIVVVFNNLGLAQQQVNDGLQAVLNEGADDIAQVAREITSTLYPPASTPGQPPHERTGALNTSIQAHHTTAPLEATVTAGGADADYAAGLETGSGTPGVAARPFMGPAAHTVEGSVQEKVDRIFGDLGR